MNQGGGRRSRTEARDDALTLVSEGTRAMVHAATEEEMMQAMCDAIVKAGNFRLAWIGFAEQDARKSVRVVASAGYDAGYLEGVDVLWSDKERGRGPTGTAIREKRTVLAENLATQPHYEPWRAEALKRGYGSSIALPLLQDGQALGALTIYAEEPGSFTQEDRAVFENLAADIAYGLGAFRLRAERERAEQELHGLHAKNDALLQSIGEGTIAIDTRGTIILANPTFERLSGVRKADLLGKNFLTAFTVLDARGKPLADAARPLKVVLETSAPTAPIEASLRRPDGTVVPVEMIASPVVLDGKIVGGINVVRDITERKRTEEQSRAASAYARSLIESTLDPLVTISPKGTITDVNEATVKATGVARERLIGSDFSDYFTEPDKARKGYKEVFEKGFVTDYPLALKHASGAVMDVLYNANVYRDAKGNVAGVFAAARDVTERKKAEREREQYFKFFAISSDIMVIADPNGAFLRVNPATTAILGYTERELISRPFIDFVAPEDKQSTLDEMARQQKIGSSLNFENRYMCKDGSVRWMSWRANFDKAEGITYATARDITERKRIEEALKTSEEKFLKAFRASPVSLTLAGMNDGVLVEANHAFEEMSGYTLAEALGKTGADLQLYPDPRERDFFVEAMKKTGPIRNAEMHTRHKSGKIRTILLSAEPISIGGKDYVLSATQDISDRKQTEIELVRLNRALRMLSEINQTLIHATDEQALLDDVSQIVIKYGGYKLMWIGFAEEDAAKTVRPVAQAGFGADYLETARITWADDERGRGPTGVAIRTGKTQIARDIHKDPNMSPWWKAAIAQGYKSSISLPFLNDGRAFGALNIYAGETDAFGGDEVKVLEELAGDLAFGILTLRMRGQVAERTHEVDQLKNKFIQVVSHQLRTPLNVIRWNLETLLERKRGEVQPAQEEVLRGSYAASTEIITRIDDLMTALDIEEKRVTLDLNEENADDLFRSVCEEELQKAKLKQIAYEVNLPKKPLPPVRMDAAKIRNVVARLIDNAVTYTRDKGHIAVTVSAKGGKIRFEITDTGIGIPASEQPHLYGRFFRGWNATQMKPDASGLGLYIAKHYVESHHGTIGFTSKENEGSTFWFELPVNG